jgi:hypothetical protein
MKWNYEWDMSFFPALSQNALPSTLFISRVWKRNAPTLLSHSLTNEEKYLGF